MVRLLKIQQLGDFLETFPGNFRTICLRFGISCRIKCVAGVALGLKLIINSHLTDNRQMAENLTDK